MATIMSDIHDSKTCTADHSHPCAACVWANEQERRQAMDNLSETIECGIAASRAIDATNAELKAYVSVFALRTAIADVLDAEGGHVALRKVMAHITEGDGRTWEYQLNPAKIWLFCDDEGEWQTELRECFMDAVVARIAQLHLPPHNAVRLENLCHRHRVARLPKPTASVCADCKREQDAACAIK